MAKKLGLSTDREFNPDSGILTITVSEVEKEEGVPGSTPTGKSFTVTLDFAEVFGEAWRSLTDIGKAALEFGGFTPLRNSTGGLSLDEAQERMTSVAANWAEGLWTEKRAKGLGGMPFGAGLALCEALVRVYPEDVKDAAAAAAYLNSQIDLDAYRAADDDVQASLRKKVRDYVKRDPRVVAAEATIVAERAAKAAAKKAAAANGGGGFRLSFGS